MSDNDKTRDMARQDQDLAAVKQVMSHAYGIHGEDFDKVHRMAIEFFIPTCRKRRGEENEVEIDADVALRAILHCCHGVWVAAVETPDNLKIRLGGDPDED